MSNKLDYYRMLSSTVLIITGAFLIVEHYMVWGGLDVFDFPFGHEYYGLIMVIGAWLLMARGKEGKWLIGKWRKKC